MKLTYIKAPEDRKYFSLYIFKY